MNGPGVTPGRGWLAPGVAYFGLVFSVGFVLGTLRSLLLLLAPGLEERTAELVELPFMVVASFLAARWVVRRFRVPAGARRRLAVGLIGLALLSAAEILVVLGIRGVSLAEYVVARDPVSGAAYLVSLGLFALMPWCIGDRDRAP